MIETDSSGWLATTSEIFLIEDAFTWPEMRATSMPASSKHSAAVTPPMPPLEASDAPRRPGDLYRERQRLRTQKNRRRAA